VSNVYWIFKKVAVPRTERAVRSWDYLSVVDSQIAPFKDTGALPLKIQITHLEKYMAC
jgi:hypothetical protein